MNNHLKYLPNFYIVNTFFVAGNLRSHFMEWTQVIGLAAGICTAASMLPQVIKTLKEKKAENVSLLMLIVLMSGLILWIIYGSMRNDIPIILTNSFSLAVNITMIILRIRYSK